MDQEPYEEWADRVCEYLEKYGLPRTAGADVQNTGPVNEENIVVDLGCGTGKLTEILADRGYDMIGVDLSEDMLSIAQERRIESGRDILYTLQDMRNFELYGAAGAMVSVGDSINYLLEEKDLEDMFACVRRGLLPGGVFVFDFKTIHLYRDVIGDRTIAEDRGECAFIWDNYYDAGTCINEYDLAVFVQEEGEDKGLFRRFDEVHRQRGYHPDQLRSRDRMQILFAGKADEAIGAYRTLTGPVPEMPEWMFGYIHCRERYHSQTEILENAAEFKARNLPLDVIVQDWQWWGPTGWNSMEFDPENYPDPKALTDSLHAMGTRFMISVWSKVDKNSNLGKRLEERGAYIDGTDWIDFFDPDVAGFYARNFVDSLARPYGIDAWWFDATEPENDDLAGRRIGKDQIPGEWYRNVYPLMVNRTMYEALTKEGLSPVILTRSAFPGAQRYGVVTWSGDVGNDFGTLRRQIAGGLGQMASGLPWWTFDAGGFFRPFDQYISAGYQERLIRWVQTSTFLPFMRVHGYMSDTEPWHYFPDTYEIIASYMDLRERLKPYILDCAARVSREGYTLLRPLVFDFPDDVEALRQNDEFMFGPALLVHPVTEVGVTTWRTYLPACEDGWRDFWTGERYEGGQYVDVPVDLATIPVFVRGDATVPEVQ